MWDVKYGSLIHTIESIESDRVRTISFSMNSKLIVTISGYNIIKIWNSQNGYLVQSLIGAEGYIIASWFNSDNDKIISVTNHYDKCIIYVWNINTGNLISTFRLVEDYRIYCDPYY